MGCGRVGKKDAKTGRFDVRKINDMEKYSVLMSVYAKDHPDYLRLAIESMLNQTVKPEQYVIVEDGPLTVELNEVIDGYKETQSELFTVVKISQNKGLSNALNVGLKECRNELIARMDADDISLPKRCEKELSFFRQYLQLDICGCNIAEFYDNPDEIQAYRIVPAKYEDIKKFLRKRTPFNHPTVMYKKSRVLESGGYSTDILRKQDYDLFSRMITNGSYVRNVEEVLFLFRANENNYARRKSKATLKNAFRVYWRHYKRGGCSLIDFTIMLGGEILFFCMPIKVMKLLSDRLLRKKNDGKD